MTINALHPGRLSAHSYSSTATIPPPVPPEDVIKKLIGKDPFSTNVEKPPAQSTDSSKHTNSLKPASKSTTHPKTFVNGVVTGSKSILPSDPGFQAAFDDIRGHHTKAPGVHNHHIIAHPGPIPPSHPATATAPTAAPPVTTTAPPPPPQTKAQQTKTTASFCIIGVVVVVGVLLLIAR